MPWNSHCSVGPMLGVRRGIGQWEQFRWRVFGLMFDRQVAYQRKSGVPERVCAAHVVRFKIAAPLCALLPLTWREEVCCASTAADSCTVYLLPTAARTEALFGDDCRHIRLCSSFCLFFWDSLCSLVVDLMFSWTLWVSSFLRILRVWHREETWKKEKRPPETSPRVWRSRFDSRFAARARTQVSQIARSCKGPFVHWSSPMVQWSVPPVAGERRLKINFSSIVVCSEKIN